MARSRSGTGGGRAAGRASEASDPSDPGPPARREPSRGPSSSAAGSAPAAADRLARYRDRRDPLATNEPFGPVRREGDRQPTRRGVFVVHQHDASRMHWDLRLEMAGALESFAVPKGPSLSPKEKRLAVHTEPHPLDYLDFEAVIPPGNYGAGAMIVWDRGVVEYPEAPGEDGLRAGKVDFLLYGTKLRGRFALVRTSGRGARGSNPRGPESWLLLKKTDPHAWEPGSPELVDEAPWSLLSGLRVDELPEAQALAEELVREATRRGAPAGDVDGGALTPMRAAMEGAPLADPAWLYELKLDGVRLLADKRPSGGGGRSQVALAYRTGRPATAAFPEIARAIEAIPGERLVLDGELVTFDDEGRPSFQRLGSRLHAQRGRERRIAQESVPVRYLVFDLLQLGDRDLRPLPLTDRKALLGELVRGKGLVRTLDHLPGDGRALLAFCTRNRLEGIMAKRGDAPYREGPRRSATWVKVKCERTDDFVVLGWTPGEGARDALGALVVGSREPGLPGKADGPPRWVERGRVGSGFDRAALDDWGERLAALDARGDRALAQRTTLRRGVRTRRGTRQVRLVRPEVVVRVRFQGWTDEGVLRGPVYEGVREDATPEECLAGPPADPEVLVLDDPPGEADGPAGATWPVASEDASRSGRSTPAGPGERTVGRGDRVVRLTNQRKVFWPEDGLTKGDLCGYYEAIAPAILPHLRDRPVTLVRHPDGIHGKRFFQWNVPRGTPDWVRTFSLSKGSSGEEDGDDGDPPEDPARRTDPGADAGGRRAAGRRGRPGRTRRQVTTFLIDDLETLLHVANLGAIPIHVMAFRTGTPDRCDFLTIDFDLGEAPLRHAVTLARSLRELLEEVGLPGFPKTSGQTGLHVLVALGATARFPAARRLADLLGQLLVRRHPDLATMERLKVKRGGRVLIDTGQTGRTRTIVAPYSVRASPGAGVSTPLTWDEVSYALDPRRFHLASVPDRVRQVGDPMAGLPEATPDLAGAVDALGTLLGPEAGDPGR